MNDAIAGLNVSDNDLGIVDHHLAVHDLNVKVRASRRFLESGNKVKVTCRFRGREITHPERARMQLEFITGQVEDLANVEQPPAME
ncbi:MAG: translation initiation factor IF-3 C-terminal domain-containing protein, partial [Anaerolineales bacterium]